MQELAAVLHVVRDDVCDRAAVGFGGRRIVEGVDPGVVVAALVSDAVGEGDDGLDDIAALVDLLRVAIEVEASLLQCANNLGGARIATRGKVGDRLVGVGIIVCGEAGERVVQGLCVSLRNEPATQAEHQKQESCELADAHLTSRLEKEAGGAWPPAFVIASGRL